MEPAKYHYLTYSPQASLPLHQSGNALSVSAGGTLSNNTYNWFKVGATDSTTITGDSTFAPTAAGMYYAHITNSLATQLTLTTDTITYPTALHSSITASAKISSAHFAVYPNPARDIIHIQTVGAATIVLINSNGKILLTKTINNTGEINVSAFTSGVYYIQNKTSGEREKVMVVH